MCESHTCTVGEVLAGRIRTVRKMRALTQRQLAERLRELGDESADQAQVSRIEKPNGTAAENLSIHRLLLIASALNIAPVHLLAPDDTGVSSRSAATGAITRRVTDEDSPETRATRVYLHRGAVVSSSDLRAWISGLVPLLGADPREYHSAMPWPEFDAQWAVTNAAHIAYQAANAKAELNDEEEQS
jgi:transcriptional regulator with XRE-family HTH domain